jgi:RNA polymerase sigma-70 factor (ECF subfamily)
VAESTSLIRRATAFVVRRRHDDFEGFVARHHSPLRGFLRRLCDDDALADDVAQETFLKARRALHTFRGEGSEASWLLRIGYREFLNTRRRKTREVHNDDEVVGIDTDAARRTSRIAERDVRRALRALSDDERAAIAACFYEGLTHDEAASVLEMPLGTLKSHVARAKEKLRGPLAAYSPATTAFTTAGATHD